MSINSEAELMRQKWESLGIQRNFSMIHHFSSSKFKTKPSGLKGFYNWCQNQEIRDENLQTVRRALKAASLFEQGQEINAAITTAWDIYPIVKR